MCSGGTGPAAAKLARQAAAGLQQLCPSLAGLQAQPDTVTTSMQLIGLPKQQLHLPGMHSRAVGMHCVRVRVDNEFRRSCSEQ
jgi:hypothetical protein